MTILDRALLPITLRATLTTGKFPEAASSKLQGRLRNPFPSALVVWGACPQQIAALRAEFPTAWHIEDGNP
jgi:hypothetical protein